MNDNILEYTTVMQRKTQVITLWDRQRRMMDFFGLDGTMYIALAKSSPWSDPDDPDISDTYPPIPDETATELTELIGMQRIQWKKYAKPYITPTSEEKDDANTVYYKGLYYKTTSDLSVALAEGFTSVILMMTADRDQYFPVDISYRQVGLYVQVGVNDEYLDDEQFNMLPEDKKGHLAAIENFEPVSRQLDQMEKFFMLLEF